LSIGFGSLEAVVGDFASALHLSVSLTLTNVTMLSFRLQAVHIKELQRWTSMPSSESFGRFCCDAHCKMSRMSELKKGNEKIVNN